MEEEPNCHVPIHFNKSDIAHAIDNSICQNLDDETVSRNSTSLQLLEEFREIYEERLRKIDEDTSGGGLELKLKTLTSWINDLGEQNVMLVQTVEQLEREAADRVALLEERLRKSSHIALEYMSALEDCDNKILDVSEEKSLPMVLQMKASATLVEAQQTEEVLQRRVSNLQNDISGLLQLIQRARNGSFDIDGLSFMEVTYEDIFGSPPHQKVNLEEKLVRHDVAVMTEYASGENETETVLLKQVDTRPTTKKRGVCFASPSKEEHKQQNEELEKTLKEAEKRKESTTKQAAVTNRSAFKNELQIMRHIEECRVNTVLAQASTEEVMEEISNLQENLQIREAKINGIEMSLLSLQNSMMYLQQDVCTLLKSVNKKQRTEDPGLSTSYSTEVQTLSQLLGTLKTDPLVSPFEKGLENQTVISEHCNCSSKFALKELLILHENLLQKEKEETDKCHAVSHFEDKLQRLLLQMKNVQRNIDDYVRDKETWHHSQVQSEQKIKKLLLELESVQEDLEQCFKISEPIDDASCLVLDGILSENI